MDWIVQNLSANNVYFLNVDTESTSTGIKIIPNGNLAKDGWLGDLILIADGAASDVRYVYQLKKITVVGGVVPVGVETPLGPVVTMPSPFEFLWKCKAKSV